MKPQVDQQQINAQARMSQVSDIPEKGVDEVKKDDSLKKPSEGIEIYLQQLNIFYSYRNKIRK